MKFAAAVTFESANQAPRVYRGEVEAGSAQSASSKAVREARKEHKGIQWSSVLVLLQKL